MADTAIKASKARRPAEESELIMAGARLKFRAAKVLSTRRIAAEAAEAAAQAIADLEAEITAQMALLPDDRRSELLSQLAA